jgi:HNH endonuclease
MVARYHPPLAKKMIRRSLRGAIDPHPSDLETDRLWQYFESACAYCGRKLGKSPKGAHIDHVEAEDTGGLNHISNGVLACAQCNEEEKLNNPWKEFLKEKSPPAERKRREQSIIRWSQLACANRRAPSKKLLRMVQEKFEDVVRRFEQALQEIRALRDASSCE